MQGTQHDIPEHNPEWATADLVDAIDQFEDEIIISFACGDRVDLPVSLLEERTLKQGVIVLEAPSNTYYLKGESAQATRSLYESLTTARSKARAYLIGAKNLSH